MARAEKPSSDLVEILHRRYVAGRPDREASLQQVRVNLDVAQKVYDLRTRAGLTQRQLAERVGTTASAICRLEDAAYGGHSLSMLQRIAAAMGHTVEVNFLPTEGGSRTNAKKTSVPRTEAARKTQDSPMRIGRAVPGRKRRAPTGRASKR